MSEKTIQPKPGDVLWANRGAKGLPYFHCGVYAGGGRVIHFAAPKGLETSAANAVVHETSYENFADGCPVKIIQYPEGYTPEETLRRARSRIGERGYDLAANNCEHFAAWCKAGEHRSTQVDEVKNIIRLAGGPAGELVCTVHDVIENYKAPLLEDSASAQRILKKFDANAEMAGTMPVNDTEEAGPEAHIIDENDAREINIAERPDTVPNENEPPKVEMPDPLPLIDRIADGLKKAAFVVAGVLEVIKTKLPPPFRLIPVSFIARKVAVGIDKAVVYIKRFTGALTKEQAHEELQNINAAELGETVVQKQRPGVPVKEAVKTAFGKVGAGIAQFVRKTVAAIVPAPIRTAIKTGWQKFTSAVASGVRTVAKVIGHGLQSAGRAIAGFFGFGKK